MTIVQVTFDVEIGPGHGKSSLERALRYRDQFNSLDPLMAEEKFGVELDLSVYDTIKRMRAEVKGPDA